jgi:hypothetical protein
MIIEIINKQKFFVFKNYLKNIISNLKYDYKLYSLTLNIYKTRMINSSQLFYYLFKQFILN